VCSGNPEQCGRLGNSKRELGRVRHGRLQMSHRFVSCPSPPLLAAGRLVCDINLPAAQLRSKRPGFPMHRLIECSDQRGPAVPGLGSAGDGRGLSESWVPVVANRAEGRVADAPDRHFGGDALCAMRASVWGQAARGGPTCPASPAFAPDRLLGLARLRRSVCPEGTLPVYLIVDRGANVMLDLVDRVTGICDRGRRVSPSRLQRRHGSNRATFRLLAWPCRFLEAGEAGRCRGERHVDRSGRRSAPRRGS
jgi:hypothetical protein